MTIYSTISTNQQNSYDLHYRFFIFMQGIGGPCKPPGAKPLSPTHSTLVSVTSVLLAFCKTN